MKTADKITVVITEHELVTIGWDDPCRPNTPNYERVKQGRCKFDLTVEEFADMWSSADTIACIAAEFGTRMTCCRLRNKLNAAADKARAAGVAV